MRNIKTTSVELRPGQVEKLRHLAATLGFIQLRGSGAGRDGSISQLMQAIADEKVRLTNSQAPESN